MNWAWFCLFLLMCSCQQTDQKSNLLGDTPVDFDGFQVYSGYQYLGLVTADDGGFKFQPITCANCSLPSNENVIAELIKNHDQEWNFCQRENSRRRRASYLEIYSIEASYGYVVDVEENTVTKGERMLTYHFFGLFTRNQAAQAAYCIDGSLADCLASAEQPYYTAEASVCDQNSDFYDDFYCGLLDKNCPQQSTTEAEAVREGP